MVVTQKSWKIILLAVFGGLIFGVLARLWMRWISTDPEFSWSGTIFIVIAFTIFSTTQASVYVLRRKAKTRRLTSVIRGGGIFLTLPIFTGAGAVMFPTVVLGSIALWQKKLDKNIRIVLAMISLIMPVIGIQNLGSDFGWNFSTLGKSLLFILIYSAVILLLKPTVSSYAGLDSKNNDNRSPNKNLIIFLIVLVASLFLVTIGVAIN